METEQTMANGERAEILRAQGLEKRFESGGREIVVLSGVQMRLAAGETLSIRGESGSGKSTLLNCLAGIEGVDSGTVYWRGRDINGLAERALVAERGRYLGYIFQAFYLLPELTVIENVILAGRINGMGRAARARARELLDAVGLAERAGSPVEHLSGGERQRVAIARALVNRPAVLLADEPTGNLDERTAERVIATLFAVVAKEQCGLVMVTHNREYAAMTAREAELRAGEMEWVRGEAG